MTSLNHFQSEHVDGGYQGATEDEIHCVLDACLPEARDDWPPYGRSRRWLTLKIIAATDHHDLFQSYRACAPK